jgi:SAM-dependent methyltransferase
MTAEIWKDQEVARAFLTERSLLIPDRPRQLEVLGRVVRHACPQARRLLDLGAGDGILLAALLAAFPQADGVAVDFSPLMLDQARQRLRTFGRRALTLEADLQHATWQASVAGPFDVIVSGFAIHHLTDERKRALYREIFDLLAEGGVFLNCEHVASTTPRIEQMFDDAMADHLYRGAGKRGSPSRRSRCARSSCNVPTGPPTSSPRWRTSAAGCGSWASGTWTASGSTSSWPFSGG